MRKLIFIVLTIKVSINEVLKGNNEITDQTSDILITIPGGQDPKNETMFLYLDGAPQLHSGDKVLFFLVKHNGLYHIQHWAMGAFHEESDSEGTSFATRAMDEEQPQSRHFGLFKNWLRSVISGKRQVPKDYYVTPVGKLSSISTRYTLFTFNSMNLRWPNFDSGSTIYFSVNGAQSGISNGA